MSESTPELVVIVGAGPGLGAAVARRLGGDRATVVLLARSQERLDDLVTTLRESGASAYGVPADVANEASTRAAFAAIRERFGDPDVLVFNPSKYIGGAPTTVDVDELVDGFKIGVAGALVAVQEVAPAMRRAGRGTVLFTGSGTAIKPYVGSSGLAVAKAGLRNLAASFADELEPDGIHVGLVTVDGVLNKGEQFTPAALAEQYWRLYAQDKASWEREVIVR
ncbi:MAG: SDR family NAD(P)-dependent oxidoreductase [Actinomycetes bacterium]